MNEIIKELLKEAEMWGADSDLVSQNISGVCNLVQELILAVKEQDKIARHALQERDLYDQRITELEKENQALRTRLKSFEKENLGTLYGLD